MQEERNLGLKAAGYRPKGDDTRPATIPSAARWTAREAREGSLAPAPDFARGHPVTGGRWDE